MTIIRQFIQAIRHYLKGANYHKEQGAIDDNLNDGGQTNNDAIPLIIQCDLPEERSKEQASQIANNYAKKLALNPDHQLFMKWSRVGSDERRAGHLDIDQYEFIERDKQGNFKNRYYVYSELNIQRPHKFEHYYIAYNAQNQIVARQNFHSI